MSGSSYFPLFKLPFVVVTPFSQTPKRKIRGHFRNLTWRYLHVFICLFVYLFIYIHILLSIFFSAKCLRYHRFLQFYSVQYVLGTGNGHFFWLEWLRPQAKKVAYRWPPTQTTWAGWICRSWMESGEILVFVDHIQCLSMFFLHGPHVWELNSPCLIVKSAIYNHHVCLWCPFLWPL
jgi:hypothetical protein